MNLEHFFENSHNIQPRNARTRVTFDLPAEQELADTVWRAAKTYRNETLKRDVFSSPEATDLILVGHVEVADIDAAVAAQPAYDTQARRATARPQDIEPNIYL